MFSVEDELHSERHATFATFAEAVAELQRLAAAPWNSVPNLPPCENWQNCSRAYEVVEYNSEASPSAEVARRPALNVSSAGVTWHEAFARRAT